MIDEVFRSVCNLLNERLTARGMERVVAAGTLNDEFIEADGKNRVVVSLVNAKLDPFTRNAPTGGGRPPVGLELSILFAATVTGDNEEAYYKALALLSYVIAFFNSMPLMTPQNAPELPSEVERVSFELDDQDFHALTNIWSMVGGSHVPSVIYRARMVFIDEGIEDRLPALITGGGAA